MMVYAIGKVSVFETSPNFEVICENDEVWEKVEYLLPDAVDRLARAPKPAHEAMGYGYLIAPDSAPKAILWKSKTKLPPDYAIGNNKIMLVSRRFRDLVEQFEPGVHQFLPVEMIHARGGDPFATFYWFICCQLIDSLDPEHTTIPWCTQNYDERMEDGFRRGFWEFAVTTPPQKAVFSLNVIGGRHLWRDPYRVRGYVHCSDAFAEAMQATGLTGFGLTHYDQV